MGWVFFATRRVFFRPFFEGCFCALGRPPGRPPRGQGPKKALLANPRLFLSPAMHPGREKTSPCLDRALIPPCAARTQPSTQLRAFFGSLHEPFGRTGLKKSPPPFANGMQRAPLMASNALRGHRARMKPQGERKTSYRPRRAFFTPREGSLYVLFEPQGLSRTFCYFIQLAPSE